jgi:hypothetical protein
MRYLEWLCGRTGYKIVRPPISIAEASETIAYLVRVRDEQRSARASQPA